MLDTQTDSCTGDITLAQRHDDLWLSDGSVVLAAEDTLFKVHKSQLSRHSVIFRDMFTLPVGETNKEGSDAEHPIVLEGIELDGFRAFLALLYPS